MSSLKALYLLWNSLLLMFTSVLKLSRLARLSLHIVPFGDPKCGTVLTVNELTPLHQGPYTICGVCMVLGIFSASYRFINKPNVFSDYFYCAVSHKSLRVVKVGQSVHLSLLIALKIFFLQTEQLLFIILKGFITSFKINLKLFL